MQQVIYWQKEIQALPVYMITIGIGCLIVFLYLIAAVIDSALFRKKVKKYMQLFTQSYDKTQNIKKTLEELITHYKPRSKEYLAIDHALYYLEHSIARDYKGALDCICDGYFESNKIRRMHKEYIERERIQFRNLLTTSAKKS